MRAHIHVPQNIGERIADSVTSFLGSWWCVGLHVTWFVAWFALKQDINLLTLIVSLEAIFLSTFVMMSQSRSGARDKRRDDVEAEEVALLLDLSKQMHTMNKRQLDLLEKLP